MRVAFIGLGIMGSRQAASLVRAGHELRVFNRTRETAEAWAQEHRAEVADSPRAAADGADVVVTMVVDGAQVDAMLLGEDGAAAGAPEGTLFVDCTTIAPADARRIGRTLTDRGHGFVDAPVTDSAPKAEDGTLTIMCGGSDADMERARPLLEAMGEKARTSGAPFPFAALARELYSAGVGRGLGEQDFAAVLEVVEGLADTRV
jgi:3-hydroxyisobutyrate dehydrogenase-like beta-hydroxyacid dehydrogenase